MNAFRGWLSSPLCQTQVTASPQDGMSQLRHRRLQDLAARPPQPVPCYPTLRLELVWCYAYHDSRLLPVLYFIKLGQVGELLAESTLAVGDRTAEW